MIGRKLSHFRILDRIGEGGMGVVYRAEDDRLQRVVALKVLPPERLADEERRLRFLREARTAAAVTHPNIAVVHEVDEADGIVFIAMELVEGRTLSQVIGGKPLPLAEALRLGAEIAEGLSAAHQAKVVHRDLKPDNVIVTPAGHVKILDFGLAKLLEERAAIDPAEASKLATVSDEMTRAGRVLGTAAYMSPEQARGLVVGGRSDLFSFGIILYEMVTGKTPFRRTTSLDTLTAILREQPLPAVQLNPEVPTELERIIGKCLEKEPGERYQDARDLVVDLRHLKRDSESQPVKSVSQGTASRATGKKQPWRWAAIGLGGILLVTSLAVLAWWLRPAVAPAATRELKQRLVVSTSEGWKYGAALSPDGEYLASAEEEGVSLRRLDTGETRRLALPEGESPRSVGWAPDGTRLLVGSSDRQQQGSIWAVPVLMGKARRLIGDDASSPDPSPDGTLISFERLVRPDIHELWIMGALGESPHRLGGLPPGWQFSGRAWSPDGRRIAYIRRSQTYTEAILETRTLEGDAGPVLLSEIRLISPFGTASGLHWLPDGRLVFSLVELPPNAADSNLWTLEVDTRTGARIGPPERLMQWAGCLFSVWGATADGGRLLIVKSQTQGDVEVGLLDAGGTRLEATRRVTLDDHNDWLTGWTLDSRRVLFSSDRNGSPDVFAQDVETGEVIPLAVGPDVEMFPIATPDGASVLYWRSPAADGLISDDRTLMHMDLSGGSARPIFRGSNANKVRCPAVPSASCVLSELNDDAIVFYALDLEKGKGEILGRLGIPPKTTPASAGDSFSLSSDGRRIAYVPYRGYSNLVRILDLGSGAIDELVFERWAELSWVGWATDGKSLFLTNCEDADGICTLLNSDMLGRTQVLLESRTPGEFIGRPYPSPDGRYLAFGPRSFTREIWILEDF